MIFRSPTYILANRNLFCFSCTLRFLLSPQSQPDNAQPTGEEPVGVQTCYFIKKGIIEQKGTYHIKFLAEGNFFPFWQWIFFGWRKFLGATWLTITKRTCSYMPSWIRTHTSECYFSFFPLVSFLVRPKRNFSGSLFFFFFANKCGKVSWPSGFQMYFLWRPKRAIVVKERLQAKKLPYWYPP